LGALIQTEGATPPLPSRRGVTGKKKKTGRVTAGRKFHRSGREKRIATGGEYGTSPWGTRGKHSSAVKGKWGGGKDKIQKGRGAERRSTKKKR